ncbi:hypothetical protein [Pyxidicoccus sp. MSG2]|uniref:hypothetical protein n=1 Tax=Pyxidicoccus sp. MSG2 TaxID=2996790 RepID=UPI00226FB653|nr:hypothetical protein [Pyxidicoccus sp. MSG2]MCY1018125.1 hypothetical protein [Pyxidicoccus sp. MSG2]
MIPRRWRGLALAASSLTALVIPMASQANEPSQPTEEVKRDSIQDQTVNGRTGIQDPFVDSAHQGQGLAVSLNGVSGMPVRRVTPDQDRMRQLSGEVVKLNGQVLYVETEVGAVVPLDLSALQIRKAPEKGQLVVATYQVENTTENVALSLAGEVPDKG